MRFRDDDRGQSVQIGAVLLFAVLIVAFSSYQAFVVPAQNQEVEFNHNQDVHAQMQELRNAIVSMPGGGSRTALSVTLGTTYPSRLVALNPGPASGTLRTVGTADPTFDLSVHNATATTDGEIRDVWNGSQRRYGTGALVYSPNYNEYDEAPETVYEHSVAFNRFSINDLPLTGQALVDGRTITLVTLDGSMGRTSSGSASVDVRPVSSSTRTVGLTNDSANSNVNVSFRSRLSASEWRDVLDGEIDPSPGTGDDDRYVAAVTDRGGSGPLYDVTVTMERGVDYRLNMAKVGVGSRVAREDPAYLVDVEGDGATVTRGDEAELVVEVRDAYNNPVPDVGVNGTVAGNATGSLNSNRTTTDENGRATFTYDATDSTNPGTHEVRFGLGTVGAGFDGSTGENATMAVEVATSNSNENAGSTALEWKNPEQTSNNDGASLPSCTAEACTWDVGNSDDETLDLNATFTPSYENVELDFAVNDSTVGTVSPNERVTGANGAGRTTLSAADNGTVSVLASGGGGSDDIAIAVVNVTAPDGTTLLLRVEDLSHQSQSSARYVASYEVRNAGSDFDRVSVLFRNGDRSWATEWDNSTAAADTRTYQNGGVAGDPYEIVVTARDASGNSLASATIDDTAANGRNATGNDRLGDGSPAFTRYTISDKSSNGNGVRYQLSYTASGTGFDRVQAFLVSLDPNDGGRAEATYTTTSINNQELSTYGYSNQDPRRFKVALLLFDDRNVVVDTVTWSDAADGSGSTSG